MTHETHEQGKQNAKQEPEYESYGWEFHKVPLLIAVVLTVLFYAFIIFYVNL